MKNRDREIKIHIFGNAPDANTFARSLFERAAEESLREDVIILRALLDRAKNGPIEDRGDDV